jgi:alanine dehydrogenase
MHVGVVTEVKLAEFRVGLTPAGVSALVADGHTVVAETGLGVGAGFSDEEYLAAGASLGSADEVWRDAELIVKVKEPIASEYGRLRSGQTLFTYLHLAADRPLTEALLSSGATAIAYETVQDDTGLPLLAPMSEVAGRLAAQAAAHQLTQFAGGPGVLLGGTPGVKPSRVLIIGGGVVGTQAALICVGLRAEVTILDTSPRRIRQLTELFGQQARVLVSDPHTLAEELAQADVVIGAVLVPGTVAPKVVRREHLALMKPDVILIDVAIDQGGCFETSRPTTYAEPTFQVDGRTHYCVANMPGGVPRTSTKALTSATLPYIRRLAAGVTTALETDPALALGLNVDRGRLVYPGVRSAFPDLDG